MNEPNNLPVAPLRRLARGLLFDDARAEDVVQDAWLAALRRRSAPANLVGWLASVVRSRALDVRRDEARRGAREERAARPEAQPSSAELSAQLELLRKLLDAVDRLDEPYRAAIGLRFFDDLPPRAIAKRLGLPVNTVRTHVRRGLERLRKELDPGDERGRDTLLAALAPFAGKVPWTLGLGLPRASAPLAGGKLALAGLGLVLVAGAWLTLRSQGAGARARESAAQVELAAATVGAPEPGPAQPSSSQGRREPVAPSRSAMSASWVVRGHATRGLHDAYPNARLVGRVYAGLRAEGTPLLEQPLTADEHGDFAWPLEPPAENVTVQVEPAMPSELASGTSDLFVPGDPAPEAWVVHSFPLDGRASGTVRDRAGHALPDVRVVHPYPEHREVRTDSTGGFTLAVSSLAGHDELWLDAPGFALQKIELGTLGPGDVRIPDVVLEPELAVRGRVLDEAGAPVAGARVVYTASFPHDDVATTSDASGAFELHSLGAERTPNLAVRAEGFAAFLRALTPEELEGGAVELRLEHGAFLSGRVLTSAHEPVSGAWISVGLSPWSHPPLETLSDAEGRFTVGPLAAGAQLVWAWHTGFAWRPVEVEVSDAQLEGLEIVLEDEHGLGGVVRDEAGQPLPWAMVYLDAAPSRSRFMTFAGLQRHTDAEGRFRFGSLPALRFEIGVLAAGHARLEMPVDGLDREDLVLVPPPAAVLAGRVEDEGGAPIVDFRVRVEFSPAARPDQQPSGLSSAWEDGVPFHDAKGRWQLSDAFEAGKVVRVTIEAEGFAPAVLDPCLTATQVDPEANVARLLRATRVRGRVVDATTGAPLAGARVRAFRSVNELAGTSHPSPATTTDANGRFEFANLSPGELSLAFDDAEHALAFDGPFELAGAPLERVIELTAGARIEGRLLDAAGNARAGEIVSLDALVAPGERSDREWSTTTATDGSYALAPLPAGVYHLRWERRRGELKVFDLLQLVELAKDDTRRVDLQPRGEATLRGTIQFDGVPPDVARVIVSSQAEPPFPSPENSHVGYTRRGRATFAENGRFEISDLEAGPHGIGVYFALSDGSTASGGTAFEMPASGVLELVVPAKKR